MRRTTITIEAIHHSIPTPPRLPPRSPSIRVFGSKQQRSTSASAPLVLLFLPSLVSRGRTRVSSNVTFSSQTRGTPPCTRSCAATQGPSISQHATLTRSACRLTTGLLYHLIPSVSSLLPPRAAPGLAPRPRGLREMSCRRKAPPTWVGALPLPRFLSTSLPRGPSLTSNHSYNSCLHTGRLDATAVSQPPTSCLAFEKKRAR